MKVKLLKKIRKRFSIYEKTGNKKTSTIYCLYDGNKEIWIGCFESHGLYRILEITRKEYAKHSKLYKFKGKKIWHGK